MKITVCIRCQTWVAGCFKLSNEEKRAIITLSAIGLFEAEYTNEVCENCRQGIGNEVSENLLKIFGNENSS